MEVKLLGNYDNTDRLSRTVALIGKTSQNIHVYVRYLSMVLQEQEL